MQPESYIAVQDGKIIAYVGPDATKLHMAILLKHSIKFWLNLGMTPPGNKGLTITRMMIATKGFTGKDYKRSRKGYAQAATDLNVWIENMRSALPIVEAPIIRQDA